MKRLADRFEEPLSSFSVAYRVHATQRMFERQIRNEDVEHVLAHGRVIEEYDDSPPYLHVLLNGKTPGKRQLHLSVVASRMAKSLTIVTAYEPDPSRWNASFTRRIS